MNKNKEINLEKIVGVSNVMNNVNDNLITFFRSDDNHREYLIKKEGIKIIDLLERSGFDFNKREEVLVKNQKVILNVLEYIIIQYQEKNINLNEEEWSYLINKSFENNKAQGLEIYRLIVQYYKKSNLNLSEKNIEELVKKIDLNMKDKLSNTALMWYFENLQNYVPVSNNLLLYLIENSNLNLCDNEGFNALNIYLKKINDDNLNKDTLNLLLEKTDLMGDINSNKITMNILIDYVNKNYNKNEIVDLIVHKMDDSVNLTKLLNELLNKKIKLKPETYAKIINQSDLSDDLLNKLISTSSLISFDVNANIENILNTKSNCVDESYLLYLILKNKLQIEEKNCQAIIKKLNNIDLKKLNNIIVFDNSNNGFIDNKELLNIFKKTSNKKNNKSDDVFDLKLNKIYLLNKSKLNNEEKKEFILDYLKTISGDKELFSIVLLYVIEKNKELNLNLKEEELEIFLNNVILNDNSYYSNKTIIAESLFINKNHEYSSEFLNKVLNKYIDAKGLYTKLIDNNKNSKFKLNEENLNFILNFDNGYYLLTLLKNNDMSVPIKVSTKRRLLINICKKVEDRNTLINYLVESPELIKEYFPLFENKKEIYKLLLEKIPKKELNQINEVKDYIEEIQNNLFINKLIIYFKNFFNKYNKKEENVVQNISNEEQRFKEIENKLSEKFIYKDEIIELYQVIIFINKFKKDENNVKLNHYFLDLFDQLIDSCIILNLNKDLNSVKNEVLLKNNIEQLSIQLKELKDNIIKNHEKKLIIINKQLTMKM